MIKNIYVAATSQHVGKTTSTLGLMAALKDKGLNVGYCKPVGQEFVDLGDLKVDKDALLFSKTMNFLLSPDYHSPVIIGRGVTKAYIENPENFNFKEKVLNASKALEAIHDIVVYEGTGHPGVGSVCDLSNADVAKMLDAPVIMIVEGGIGNTLDRLNTNLALFREQDIKILGVIVNKVLPQKMDQVKYYVGKKLERMGIPLLGILPYEKSLANPIMENIRQAVGGTTLANSENLDNKVEHIVSGALVERKEMKHLKNLLLIVNASRLQEALLGVDEIARNNGLAEFPVCGIIINYPSDFSENLRNDAKSMTYINKYKIPVVATTLDTYGSAVKIDHIEVKINTRTPWKADKAIELIKAHVDLDLLISDE